MIAERRHEEAFLRKQRRGLPARRQVPREDERTLSSAQDRRATPFAGHRVPALLGTTHGVSARRIAQGAQRGGARLCGGPDDEGELHCGGGAHDDARDARARDDVLRGVRHRLLRNERGASNL